MSERVLVVEGDTQRAKALCHLLKEVGGGEPVHVPTVVAALRELQGQPFALIVTNTTLQRPMDGFKLIQRILLEQPPAHHPLVMVVTTERDPAVVQQCIRAGVADYLLYPCTPEVLVQRVRKAMHQLPHLSEKLVSIATPYLGPAARVFLERQAKDHIGNLGFDDLREEHLPELLRWVQIAVKPVIEDKAEELIHRIELTFNVKCRRETAA